MDALNPELTGLHPFTARVAAPSDAAALRQLWNLFCHDLPDITRALPDHAGSYRNDRLNNALASTPGWTAWIIAAGVDPVGFAVERALDEPVAVLCSFFIVKAARGGGLGRRFAQSVLTSRPGTWAIAFQDANPAAVRFWPAVASLLDPAWTLERRPVPGRPDLPPDSWISSPTNSPSSSNPTESPAGHSPHPSGHDRFPSRPPPR